VLIPERLSNFRCYAGKTSLEQFGLSDIELPKFESLTENIAGAGIAGEYESVVLGHFKSMVVKLKWLAVNAAGVLLLQPVVQDFDFRGSVQMQDTSLRALVTKPVRVTCSGQVKGMSLGKFEPGKRMDNDVDIEVGAISVFVDDIALVELDKFNMIFKVNGFDYLRSVRQDLGGI
jgi:P2 family phage contractile tail tube protein